MTVYSVRRHIRRSRKRRTPSERFDRALGKLTADYLAVRASAMFMHESMICALESGDSTFTLANCDDSLSLLMEKLGRCKAVADRLRASVGEADKHGKLRRLDAVKYGLWFDELDALHTAILNGDIRPQEEMRARAFGAEGKIFRLHGGTALER